MTVVETSESSHRLARPGRNCWKIVRADRLALLIDGAAYFERLAVSLERARRSVRIVGWDIHSRMRLRRDAPAARSELGPLLDGCARKKRGPHVHVLSWDHAMIYAIEREFLPIYHFGWKTHRRVHFALDGNHPLGACHHQKIVVIDDRVAYLGGLDLTMRRWDTPEHRPDDPVRVDPHGNRYQPFHDVQAAVSGPAARALGDLVRERWRRATGKRLRAATVGGDPWPGDLEPDLRGVEVALARTEPEHAGREEVREIEAMYRDAIASARRFVFIENQYLTSSMIRAALAASLHGERGPEICIVLPKKAAGWLEQSTMGHLAARLVEQLRAVDRRGRLRVYFPQLDDLGEARIKLHSKVCIVDDRFLTVGSTNLANRSMGLDTECNLFVEAAGQAGTEKAIAAFRDRLLAEHLGTKPSEVARAHADTGSLLETVESLRRGPRRLDTFEPEPSTLGQTLIPDEQLLDPERPMAVGEIVTRFVDDGSDSDGRAGWVPLATMALLIGGLGLTWRWGPLGEWASADRVASWISAYRDSPFALAYTAVGYTVAAAVFFPVTLLILQTSLIFSAAQAALHAVVGSLCSAVVSYGIGRAIGRHRVRRVLGRRAARVNRVFERSGALSVAALRILPIAPFTLVNLVAGAGGVRLRSFMAGTLAGLGPGIVVLTLVGGQAARAIRDPGWQSGLLLLVVVGVAVSWIKFLSRRALT